MTDPQARSTPTDKSAYAYFGRVFLKLWRDPTEPLWRKVVVTLVSIVAGVVGSIGVSVFQGGKRIAKAFH